MTHRSPILRPLMSAVAALPLVLGAVAAQAQEVTIKFSHFLPPNSNFHKNVLEPWCAAIAKDSGNKLKCQAYPALQLGGTPPQIADQVKNGVADIAWTSPSYSTGRFPRTEALELPFTLPPGGLAGSKAMWEYYQKNGQEDFKDFHVLAIFSASNVVMSTANKPILTVDGFKGVKLRSPSRFAALFLTSLGGTPVNIPIAQVTESISKGVIDGAMVPWEGVPTVKLHEFAKSHLDVPAGQLKFANSLFAFVMNQAKYNSLSPELKKVIDDNSGLATSAWAGETGFDRVVPANHKLSADRGNALLKLDAAEYARWVKASDNVDDEWVKEANAKGANGAALLEEARALINQYDK